MDSAADFHIYKCLHVTLITLLCRCYCGPNHLFTFVIRKGLCPPFCIYLWTKFIVFNFLCENVMLICWYNHHSKWHEMFISFRVKLIKLENENFGSKIFNSHVTTWKLFSILWSFIIQHTKFMCAHKTITKLREKASAVINHRSSF